MDKIKLQEDYGTLSETIHALNEIGYTLDFNVRDNCLVCQKTNIQLSPQDFQIDKFYRFEGMSDPEDQAILYAISSHKFEVRGLLVNSFGMDADEYSAELIGKLNTHGGHLS
ncbi:MAG: phosphoribosylpyrophosphate synthetase [Saprospiraceae bacterium]|nr:phosphoribosylpyrophosphate synthetase [Saprospiraceae bacterium]